MNYYSLKAYASLKLIIPNWSIVKKYYKARMLRILYWIIEWAIVVIWWVIKESDMNSLYFYSILNAIGIVFDIYFCYVIYSCYKFGIQGDLRNEMTQVTGNQRVMPTYNDVQAIGMDNAQYTFNPSPVKEVVAYSHDNLKVIDLNTIPIHDFTKITQ